MNQFNLSKLPKIPKGSILTFGGPILLSIGGYVLVNHCVYNVEGGHRAIMYNRIGGISNVIKGEGTHFKLPWFQRPYLFNVRSKHRTFQSLTGSRDLQMVDIQLRIIFRPMNDKLPEMYKQLGLDYDERVLPSIANEVLKSVVAQYNAIELIGKREEVSQQVRSRLESRAKDFFMVIDDVSLTHLAFSPQYAMAVEAKQVAQQEAEMAKYIVDKARAEKEGIIVSAKGEAEAAKLIATAVANNPGFVQLREIQYAKDVANTIASSNFKVYLSSDVLLMSGLARALNEKPSPRKSGFLSMFGL